MARGMKRPAAAQVGQGKKRAADSAGAKCVEIAAVLKKEGIPTQSVADMLASSVKATLGIYKADRHPNQEDVAKMIGEALGAIEAAKKETVDAAQAKVSGGDEEKERREKACADAKAKYEELLRAASEAQDALTACNEKVDEAGAAVANAKAVHKENSAALSKAQSDKQRLDACKLALGDAALETTQVKECIKEFQKLEFDSEMIKFVGDVLVRPPAERSAFHNIVMKQLEEEMASKTTAVDAILAAAEASTTDRAEAVTAAQATFEAAGQVVAAAKEKVKEAVKARTVGLTAQTDAEKAVAAYSKDMAIYAKDLKAAKEDLAAFSSKYMAAYQSLLEYAPAPPEPEEREQKDEAADATPVAAEEPTVAVVDK